MGERPSQTRDEHGLLTERAIATPVAGDPQENEATASRPYREPTPTKDPVPTKNTGPAPRFKSTRRSQTEAKAIEEDEAEDKGVKGTRRGRARK